MKIIDPLPNIENDENFWWKKIGTLSNEELRSLLQEIHKIGLKDRPVLARKSKLLKLLYNNHPHKDFSDKMWEIKRYAINEVITRFRKHEI